MEEIESYLNMRFKSVLIGIITCIFYQKNIMLFFIYFEFSLKYMILDETNVTKYGQNAAIIPYIINKVIY